MPFAPKGELPPLPEDQGRTPGVSPTQDRRSFPSAAPFTNTVNSPVNLARRGLQETGFILPHGKLIDKLRAAKSNRSQITPGQRAALAIEMVALDPQERARNDLHIFTSMPDSTVLSRYPTEIINYSIWLAFPDQGSMLPNQFIELTRYGMSDVINDPDIGTSPKDEKLRTVDSLMSLHSETLSHPGLSHRMLQGMLKLCDSKIKELKHNGGNTSNHGERGGKGRGYDRRESSQFEYWNRVKHTLVADFMQSAIQMEEQFPHLGDLFDFTRENVYGDVFHITIDILGVDMKIYKLIGAAVGAREPMSEEDIIETRTIPDLYTTINLNRIREIAEKARIENREAQAEEWLADYFDNVYL